MNLTDAKQRKSLTKQMRYPSLPYPKREALGGV